MSIQVNVYGDDFEKTINQFKKLVNKDGILRQLKIRSTFESPSQRRKRKDAESVRRMKRRLARGKQQQEYFVRGHDQQYFAARRKKLAEQHEPGTLSTEALEVVEVRREC